MRGLGNSEGRTWCALVDYKLHRVTSPRGRILATTRQPGTTNPAQRSYLSQDFAPPEGAAARAVGIKPAHLDKPTDLTKHLIPRSFLSLGRGCESLAKRNVERGRATGQVRLRLVLNGIRGAWFDLLLLAAKENWELTRVFPRDDFERGYSVVMEKSPTSANSRE